MGRNYKILLLLLVLAYGGHLLMAADGIDPEPLPSNPLAGKSVIIEQQGYVWRVMENVTLNNGFLRFKVKDREGAEYDHWLPVHKVDHLKVFDRREDALAYRKKHSPGLYKDNDE